jgi:hypothetical protein
MQQLKFKPQGALSELMVVVMQAHNDVLNQAPRRFLILKKVVKKLRNGSQVARLSPVHYDEQVLLPEQLIGAFKQRCNDRLKVPDVKDGQTAVAWSPA